MSVTQDSAHGKGEGDDVESKHDDKHEPKTVTVFVGEQEVESPKKTPPRDLLVAAGLDPTKRRLVRVNGKHQEPFEDPDQPITVHEGERFITVSTGGTPVS